MRKLKLDVDTLQVESFVAASHAAPGGTVQGQISPPNHDDGGSTTCDGGDWGSLFGTCINCPTVGTCVGPTYCCQPTWRPSCLPSCGGVSCPLEDCGGY